MSSFLKYQNLWEKFSKNPFSSSLSQQQLTSKHNSASVIEIENRL